MKEYPKQYDVVDGLIYDSFLGDADEVMFSYFIEAVEKIFGADAHAYSCCVIKGLGMYPKQFEPYLTAKKLNYLCKGFDIPRRKEMPARSIVHLEKDGLNLRSPKMAIYRIAADSPSEIFVQFSGTDISRGGVKVFAAYRDFSALKELFERVRDSYRQERRLGKRVMTSSDEEIRTELLEWDDIILPDAQIKDIRLSIDSFLRSGDLFRSRGIPYKRGILFAGAPGNGKTMLCKVIASQSRLPFILHSMNADPYHSDIDHAFEQALELSPSIICFEDLDLISNSPTELGYLLNKLDGIEPLEGILVLATTKKPEDIDPALRNRPSRFDRVYRISLPDDLGREQMLRKYFGNSLGGALLDEVVKLTDGFSMAYLKELFIYTTILSMDRNEEGISEALIFHAAEMLREQMKNSKKPVEDVSRREIGFASRRRHRDWLGEDW